MIKNYTNRGYHKPKFSSDNNIFKIDALIEENTKKIELMLMEGLKNKNKILAPKLLMFLNKLNYLVKKRTLKDSNLIAQYHKILLKNESLIKKLTIEKLKEDIQNIIKLVKIQKIKKLKSDKSKRKLSFISPIPKFNNYRINNSKKPNKLELSPINIDIANSDNSSNNNDAMLSTERSLNLFQKRKSFSFSTVRLMYPIKKIETMISNNQKESSKKAKKINNTENNNQIKKNFFLVKSNSSLKTESFIIKEKNNNIIKKINDYKSSTKNTSPSYKEKYSRQAKRKIYYNIAKNNYFLGLKKISDNKQGDQYMSQNEFGEYTDNSIDNAKKNYIISKTHTEEKTDNINFSSDTVKSGITKKFKEKKSEFLNNAYKELKKGKYNSVENIMHGYLKDIKKLDSNKYDNLMERYSFKNFGNNLTELSKKICDNSIRKKIEKIYYNTNILKKILPSLNIMKENEKNIDKLEKKYASISIQNYL